VGSKQCRLAALRGGNKGDLIVGRKLAAGPVGFGDYGLIDRDSDAFTGAPKELGYELIDRVRSDDLGCLTVEHDFHSKFSFKYKKP
jgi:hypothetical protein